LDVDLVARTCTTRRVIALLALLVSAATVLLPINALAGGFCDGGGGPSSMTGPWAAASVVPPPPAGRVVAPPMLAAAADRSSITSAPAQPKIVYAPGVRPRTQGHAKTLGAWPAPATSAPAGIVSPASTFVQPKIVYAPGAGPRAATSGIANRVADTALGSPVVVRAAGDLARVHLSADDCDALARVTYAEAGNQGPEGLAAVIYTILNRVASGRFQSTVQAVIDARDQFEPATRAGGWRHLPPLSPGLQAQFDFLLAGILSGRIPDPTRGALYFQNRAVVAARAAAGLVPWSLVDYGGQSPLAEIRDHRFYGDPATPAAASDILEWR
jgi:hypothetical protein